MPRTSPSAPISHWHTLLDEFSTSSQDFYESVKAGIDMRQVPDASMTKMAYYEGGAFSAKREYLRIKRGRYIFDICAAPFGRGFLFSWWLGENTPSPILPTLAAFIGLFILWIICVSIFGIFQGFWAFWFLFGILFLSIGAAISQGEADWADNILVIPILGTLIERLFQPVTYYRMDMMYAFQDSVHNTVLEVIDQLTSAKGIRALSEPERKPILQEFYRR